VRNAKAGSGSASAEREGSRLSHQLKGLSGWLLSGMNDVMLRMTNDDGTLAVLKYLGTVWSLHGRRMNGSPSSFTSCRHRHDFLAIGAKSSVRL